MVSSIEDRDVAALPLAPRNPLPLWRQLTAARAFNTGPETLRDAGGPVTRVILGPKRLMPPVVIVTSPQGARDVLGRTDAVAERGETPMATELRRLMGGNLLVLPHDEWLPRRRAVQPLFTKKHVQGFGGHMAQAAQQVGGSRADLEGCVEAPRHGQVGPQARADPTDGHHLAVTDRHHRGRIDLTTFREQLAQTLVGRCEVQTTDEQFVRHEAPP